MKTYTSLFILSTLATYIVAEDRWVWSGGRSNDNRQSKSVKFNNDFNNDAYDSGAQLRGEYSIAQPVVAEPNRNRNSKNQNQNDLFNPNLDRDRNNYNRRQQNRYEVEENLNSGLITVQPSRPFKNPNVISLPPRPIPGPIPLPQDQRPGDRFPPPGGLPPQGNLVPAQSRPGQSIAGPPPPSVGILTGPVPSWEKGPLNKNGDPTSFQNCKCAHSFNCKAPGIQFGKCDEGKQYCCFNDLNGPNKKDHGGPIGGPIRGGDGFDGPIRGGNGPIRGGRDGPIRGGDGPIRGGDSEGFGSAPFILTGPSGPDGHYGAKPVKNNRPFRGPNQQFNGNVRDYDDFEQPSRYSEFDRRSANKRH